MSKPAPSLSRQKSSARLFAVQGVYQLLLTGQSASEIIENMMDPEVAREPEMADVVVPLADLLRQIIGGVGRTRPDLLPVIGNHLKNDRTIVQLQDQEPLLLAILLAGAYELMAHQDIDAPIIINDYLEVARSYYDGNESSFINGILDNLKVLYRVPAAPPLV